MSDIKFLLLQKPMNQPDFENHLHIVMVNVGEIHIVYQGRVMCGATKDALKKKYDTKTVKETTLNPGKNVCGKCQKAYKANGQLDWYKWVQNTEEMRIK